MTAYDSNVYRTNKAQRAFTVTLKIPTKNNVCLDIRKVQTYSKIIIWVSQIK